MSNECAGSRKKPFIQQSIKTGHLSCFFSCQQEFLPVTFPSKIHSALPSENFTFFLWRRIKPEPTAKHFLENVSEWTVHLDPTYYPSLIQRDTQMESSWGFLPHTLACLGDTNEQMCNGSRPHWCINMLDSKIMVFFFPSKISMYVCNLRITPSWL